MLTDSSSGGDGLHLLGEGEDSPLSAPHPGQKRVKGPYRSRIPEAAITAAVETVQQGGPDCNVAAIARDHGLSPVTLNRIVRRRLERDGKPGLSSAAARSAGRSATLAAVEALVAEGRTLKDACRELGVPYSRMAKARSRRRMIERFEAVRDAMVAAGASPHDLAITGTIYRNCGDAVLRAGQTLAGWLGPAYRTGAIHAGEDPVALARPFALWLSGHY